MSNRLSNAPTRDAALARKRSQSGLTTIEVVAALLLFSIALIPITQVQLNAQRNAQTVANVTMVAGLERQALIYLRTVNFARNRTGTYDFDNGTISWRAEIVTESSQIALGDDRVSLFRVVVEIKPNMGQPSTRTLHAIGWS